MSNCKRLSNEGHPCVIQLLENLVVAMESEAQVIDISRVSGFMQKVRNATIAVTRFVEVHVAPIGSEWCDIVA